MVTLSDGRVITYDLRKLSVLEYRAIFEPGSKFEDEEATLARVCGLTVEDLHSMSLYDNKLLWKRFFKVCSDPLAEIDDPKA